LLVNLVGSQIRDSDNGECEALERDLHKAHEAEAQSLPGRILRAPHLYQQGIFLNSLIYQI
jgi:hypothetical protein